MVCPFFNEAAILAEAVTRMVGNLNRLNQSWELILVDDGSIDGSAQLALKALASVVVNGHYRLVGYPQNAGRGHALKTGIDLAKGEIIVTTEADCSWGDDIVEQLVSALGANSAADFVVASVHMPGGGLANVPGHRTWLTRWGNRLIRAFFNSTVSMNTGMTRAYRAPVIQPLPTHEFGKEFHLEVLLKLLTLGFKAVEIPATITWTAKKAGAPTRKSSTRILRTIGTHLRFLAVAQPTRYFSAAAALSCLVGLAFEAGAIVELIAGGPSIYLAIMGMIVLLFALLFTGFTVLFTQVRESLREQWMQAYPKPWPPNRRIVVDLTAIDE